MKKPTSFYQLSVKKSGVEETLLLTFVDRGEAWATSDLLVGHGYQVAFAPEGAMIYHDAEDAFRCVLDFLK